MPPLLEDRDLEIVKGRLSKDLRHDTWLPATVGNHAFATTDAWPDALRTTLEFRHFRLQDAAHCRGQSIVVRHLDPFLKHGSDSQFDPSKDSVKLCR